MKKAIATMILLGAAGCALAQTNQNEPKKTAPAAAQIVTLPKDAARNGNDTYYWTDKQGKSWIYSKTAAGFVRAPAPAIPLHGVQIPKDAVASPDGSYLWTDKDGKKWAFFTTPFGIVKNAVAAPAPETTDPYTKVTDKGDTVRFERPTPFGVSAYEKKKSELNDDERRLYDARKAKPE